MSSLLSTEWPLLTILTTSGSKMKTFKRVTNMCCLLIFFFFFETKWQNWAKLQSFSLSFYEPKVWNTLGDTLLQWNTLGDTLLQHVTMTNHCLCTGQATSCVTCCNNKLLYVLGNFLKIFISATEFCHWTNRFWFEFVWLIAGTKFSCGDKGFHKILPYTQRICHMIAICCRYVLVQLVT